MEHIIANMTDDRTDETQRLRRSDHEVLETDATLDVLGAAALALADAMWDVQKFDRSDSAALCFVNDNPGASIDELSRRVGLAHSSGVRLVDRLESAGLLRRSKSGPGRRISLDLTSRGRKAAQSNQRARHAVLSLAVRGLDERVLAELKALARSVVLNIAQDQPEIDRACRLCDQRSCFAAGCPLPGLPPS